MPRPRKLLFGTWIRARRLRADIQLARILGFNYSAFIRKLVRAHVLRAKGAHSGADWWRPEFDEFLEARRRIDSCQKAKNPVRFTLTRLCEDWRSTSPIALSSKEIQDRVLLETGRKDVTVNNIDVQFQKLAREERSWHRRFGLRQGVATEFDFCRKGFVVEGMVSQLAIRRTGRKFWRRFWLPGGGEIVEVKIVDGEKRERIVSEVRNYLNENAEAWRPRRREGLNRKTL